MYLPELSLELLNLMTLFTDTTLRTLILLFIRKFCLEWISKVERVLVVSGSGDLLSQPVFLAIA